MDRTTPPDARWPVIEQRLRDLQPVLRRQGTIVMKTGRKSPAWSLRYKAYSAGKRVQKSVYLGTDLSLVQRARELLEHFRKLERWDSDVDLARRRMKGIVALLKRPRRSDRKLVNVRGTNRL